MAEVGPDPGTTVAVDGPQALMALLAELEEDHPVDRWVVGDLHVWPLVRIRLAHRIARIIDGRPARPPVGAWGDLSRRAAAALRGSTAGIQRQARAHSGSRTCQVAICGDGVSFLATPSGPIDRHADPFRQALSEVGVGTVLLEPGHHVPRGLAAPVISIQPALDRRLVGARIRPRPAPHLPGYDALASALADRNLDEALPEPGAIALSAAVVEAMADAFERSLRRLGVGGGAVVEFYALQGAAFVLACRRLGLPVIDIQHGLQGPLHYAYAGWGRAPAGGYDLLPDRFWVWGEEEAATIAAWAPERETRCLVGGNLEVRSWVTGAAPGAAEAHAAVTRLAPDGCPFVLVALSDEESDGELDAMLATIADAPDAWRWGLRCHPTDPAVPRWERAVHARGLRGVEVRQSTELPLFALLQRADALVTRHSSVVLDAAAAGVPAVVTGSLGAELFRPQIAARQAILAPPGEVVASVAAALGRGARPTALTDPSPALRAVAELAGCAP